MIVCRPCRYGNMIFHSNDSYVGGSLLAYGEYSQFEVDLLLMLVGPTDTVVEVGSNVGAITVPLLYKVKHVIAFEPQTGLLPLLMANCMLTNRSGEVQGLGLSDNPGKIDSAHVNYAAERMVNGGGLELERDFGPNVPRETIKLITLDMLQLKELHLLKADVEGMEEKVLRGGERTIRKFRPILYVEDNRPEKHVSLRACITEFGYTAYNHHPPLYNPNNFHGNPRNLFENEVSHNVICWPNERPLPSFLTVEENAHE